MLKKNHIYYINIKPKHKAHILPKTLLIYTEPKNFIACKEFLKRVNTFSNIFKFQQLEKHHDTCALCYHLPHWLKTTDKKANHTLVLPNLTL